MKNQLGKLFLLVVLSFVFYGCAETMYAEQGRLPNGATLTQFGRVGVFGTDAHGAVYEPAAPKGPPVLTLETDYQRDFKSWNSKCGNPSQARNFHFEKERQSWRQEVPNQAAQCQPIVIGGSNPSTGNAVLPAAIGAMGTIGAAVLTPKPNISITGGGAQITGSGNSSSSSSSKSKADVDSRNSNYIRVDP